jgi:hypothetical protein
MEKVCEINIESHLLLTSRKQAYDTVDICVKHYRNLGSLINWLGGHGNRAV